MLASLFVTAMAWAQDGNTNERLNPNTVELAALAGLPHMSETLSKAIVAQRPFASMAAVDALIAKSLNPTQRGELYQRLFLPIDLNTASRAEIDLIPGMTKRMAHEFEEYRPYKSLDEFRREIGKYVDATELARLESYVTLK
ncbi:MAG TPA: helix-hairpin-helix domain-containing protein [Steroidobacteraceae bacterium]|nr:helix-hairpin-helix domain-containing protein [Steroidobacteraceae bacterium]